MKKNILFSILSFLSFVLTAQPQFSAGGKLGLGIGQVTSNLVTGAEESNYGVQLGVVGSMSVGTSGKMFLLGELLYSQKGGKNYVSGINKLSYLDLPILTRFTFPVKKDFPLLLYFNAGPYFGIKLSRSVEGIADYNTSELKSTPVEMGLCAGGGLLYPIGNGNVFIEGRYAFAVNSLVTETLERNRLSTISVGYLFTIKGKTQEEKDKTIDTGFSENDNTSNNKDEETKTSVKEKKKKKEKKSESDLDEPKEEKVKEKKVKEKKIRAKKEKIEEPSENKTEGEEKVKEKKVKEKKVKEKKVKEDKKVEENSGSGEEIETVEKKKRSKKEEQEAHKEKKAGGSSTRPARKIIPQSE